jgi:magnesium-transporting ATPase (P-type)
MRHNRKRLILSLLEFFFYSLHREIAASSLLFDFQPLRLKEKQLAVDNKLAGIISIADTIKGNARQAVDLLKSMGIKVVMITGDNMKLLK